jgi:hypothetical protein
MKYHVWWRLTVEEADDDTDHYENVWGVDEETKIGTFSTKEKAIKYAESVLNNAMYGT